MDNLKYYNDSLAYDFEMFMPKTAQKKEPRENIVVMPRKAAKAKKRKAAAVKSLSAPTAAIMANTRASPVMIRILVRMRSSISLANSSYCFVL